MLYRVIRHDMEDIWAVWRVRRKATSGVLIDPGARAAESDEELVDEAEPRVVESSSKSPPSAAGTVAKRSKTVRSKRICPRWITLTTKTVAIREVVRSVSFREG
jgi:hypothetical protein